MDTILIIDDNMSFLHDVEALLGSRFKIVTASSGRKGFEILQSEPVSAVLLDLNMPEMHGTEVLMKIHAQIDSHLPIIVVTDQSEVDTAVNAMQLGAYDFIPKSFDLDLLTAKIVKALERRSLEISVDALQSSQAEQYNRMICVSEGMKKVHRDIMSLARIDFDVLIFGETGVGKDLTAFEIHQQSARRDKPFIPLAVRALNETLIESELFGHEKGAFSGADRAKFGKLEAANGGTVYIPEISSLGESIQLKLLHFMQYKTMTRVGQDPKKPAIRLDVRLLMATNEALEEVVKKGVMREDFFHRITGVRMSIPPLRERIDDIEPMAEYFLKKFSTGIGRPAYSLSREVVSALRSYHWPGNVRELENMIKHAVVFSMNDELTLAEFPHLGGGNQIIEQDPCRNCLNTRFPTLPPLREAEANFKRAYLQEVLRRSDNLVSKAADHAGITPQGFRKLMHQLTESEE